MGNLGSFIHPDVTLTCTQLNIVVTVVVDNTVILFVFVCPLAVEKDGVVQPYNDSGVVDVYESCADCLVVIYKNIHGQYLLIYSKLTTQTHTHILRQYISIEI